MNITGLDHIQLAMPPGREAEARHFYAELLGLTEINKPQPLAGRGGCWFEGPHIFIHLGVEADFRPARKAHPCFRVTDLAAARQVLEAAGFEPALDDSVPQVRRFFAADPFGNRLEFMQEGDRF
jgi:catechol 2,3-dioxygenase-like lactoylglutathione lyase family enzyme